jgi:tetratricopeptide (TPR) repeat protein
MDWLVTGGVLGLIAYLSLFVIGGYYLLWAPFKTKKPPFTTLEYGLLIGIGSAYFVHNLVVFDNLVSYIFFAIVLALVHSRVSTPIVALEKKKIDPVVVTQIFTPVVVVATILVVYFVNVPGMKAAGDIINAFRATTIADKQAAFDTAFARNSFAQQELTEQMAQQALGMIGNTSYDQAEVTAFIASAGERLVALAKDKPGDARVHVFLTSFYRGINDLENARKQAAIARTLSPTKPHIILDQGMVEYQAGNLEGMNAFMKESYELSPENKDAQMYYAASMLLTGSSEEEAMSVVAEDTWEQFAANNFVIQAADRAGANNIMKRVLEMRIAAATSTPQNYFSLSFVHYRIGEIDEAIATLERAIEAAPSIETAASCYINNLKNNIEPNTGC